ncbi:MMPL family transporter [Frankia sp. AgB32]|uniref:MMPL family transporter n=1 Tax=Frankia sp. AgB32 TaxID=631119 RepID=UPI00200E300C|nr:MMPL family transporter [Frankia sp. AgB32]MCK9898220.1 MMPL family transporter [Frankia sp. AgB32]
MALLVRWCQRNRWLVVAVWLVAMIAGLTAVQDVGSRYSLDLGNAGAESAHALDLVGKVLNGNGLPDNETVTVRARQGTVQEPEVRTRVAEMIARIGRIPGVAGAFDPYSPAGAVPIGGSPLSADGHALIFAVLMKGSATAPDTVAIHHLMDIIAAYNGPDLQVDVIGPGSTAVTQAAISPGPILIGLAIALVLLALTVRSPAAVAVCALAGMASVVGSIVAVTLLSHRASMMALAPLLAVVLAFGMSLGSAVVIVNRAQNGLRAGLAPPDAVRAAMRRPGRATLGGGLVLALVMLATSALHLNTFAGLALAGFATAVVSILAIATLLPAMLRIAGRGLLVWVERTQLRATGAGLPVRPGLRSWWAGALGRHPRIYAGAAVLLLVVLALPVVGLRLGGSDGGVDATSTTTRRAFDVISDEFFPGLNSPIVVVATGLAASPPQASTHLVDALMATPGVQRSFISLRNDKVDGEMIQVIPHDAPRARTVSQLIHQLRTKTVPAATEGTALKVYIGGQTAIFDDASARFTQILPVFIGLELAMLGLTVLIALRSVRHSIAVMAASLLALAATLGVITTIFVDGRFTAAMGVRSGPIEPFVLGLVMIIVFGLAIGMHLTMLSRLWGAAGERNQTQAISSRHADVGHVVVATNMIMVAVFLSLAAQHVRIMKLLGVGLSVGVILDALVVRVILLPALVHLVGLGGRGDAVTTRSRSTGANRTGAGATGRVARRHAQATNPGGAAGSPAGDPDEARRPRITVPIARQKAGGAQATGGGARHGRGAATSPQPSTGGRRRASTRHSRDAATAAPAHTAAPARTGGTRRGTGISDRASARSGPSQSESSASRRPWDAEQTPGWSRWSD